MRNPFRRKLKIYVWVESYKGVKNLRVVEASPSKNISVYTIAINNYQNVKVRVDK